MREDADFLAANGFNTVRIGILFPGVMPQPGVIDTAYLDAWQRVIDLLAERHIWVMIDFHQDMFNEKFQGEGFPAWAVSQPTTGALPDPTLGFPSNYFTPQVSEAFDQLYANAGGVQDYAAQAWKAVAERFKDQPYLMGYDLINEPWPGLDYASCANSVGCPSDTTKLEPYLNRLRPIRQVDTDNIVWYEPNVMFDFGAGSMLQGPGHDPQLGFSWHAYCLTGVALHAQGFTDLPGCAQLENLVFDNAEAVSDRIGATQVLSEFGASDDLPDIELMAELADERLVGWQYWHYKLWRDPTTESQTSGAQGLFVKDDDLSTLKQEKADLLVRTYPMATAGEPLELAYEPDTGDFTYTFKPGPVAGTPLTPSSTTEIFVSPRRYPDGYVASVQGGRAVSAPGARILEVVADPGATTTTVMLTAAAAAADPSPTTPSDTATSGGDRDAEATTASGRARLADTGTTSAVAMGGFLLIAAALVVRRQRRHA